MPIKSLITILGLTLLLASCSHVDLDSQLQPLLKEHKVTSLESIAETNQAKIKLGQMLFFDKILSGNKDISCATCHHPKFKSSDGLSLSIGTGGAGLGTERHFISKRPFVPRNATDLFNRGDKNWTTMFWDNRVRIEDAMLVTPADNRLPKGLDNLLAVQAMFPVTSRVEMRGRAGDVTVSGELNELAAIADSEMPDMWNALMQRLLAIDGYVELFQEAYPDVPTTKLGFQHAANAIAAFEATQFSFIASPFDQYLEGDKTALNESAKRGAILFYGDAKCGSCHSGPLLSDQKPHNAGIPQLGPGKGLIFEPLDVGHLLVSGQEEDRFKFRTPPLRNVALSAPYMHNGAFESLEMVIEHYNDVEPFLSDFTGQGLSPQLKALLHNDQVTVQAVLQTLDDELKNPLQLSEQNEQDVLAFLKALTDPKARTLNHLIPKKVPSSLPVTD